MMERHFAKNPTSTHACEKKIGYKFKDPLLLFEALQSQGSWTAVTSGPRLAEGNKRLAVLGDKVLDLLLAMKWYPTWEKRGIFDRLRNEVTSNENFLAVCVNADLQQFISLPNGGVSIQPKAMATSVEAIIGAVYLDGGLESVKKVAQELGIDVCEKVASA
ncbi:MAG: hypothetical protein Q9201_002137 [Fulgogasparrea decipioides]